MENHLLCGLQHYFQVLNPSTARGRVVSCDVTHLNARDAFHPSSPSFFLLSFLSLPQFLRAFLVILLSHYFLSLSLSSSVVDFSASPTCLCHLSSPFTKLHLILHLKVNITSDSFDRIPPAGISTDKQHSESRPLLFLCT